MAKGITNSLMSELVITMFCDYFISFEINLLHLETKKEGAKKPPLLLLDFVLWGCLF